MFWNYFMKKQVIPLIVTTLFALALTVSSAWAQAPGLEEATWTAAYWNNVDFSGPPVLTRTETAVNHRWDHGSPDPAINPDRFSARWTTTVELEEGLYRFTTISDDGVRVWVGGEQIIDNWTVHAEQVDAATVSLPAGVYEIVIEYFENTGIATMIFNWERLDEAVDCGARYVVQAGDWLSRIARQCGVSVARLLTANPQVTNPSAIWPGLVLVIPDPEVTATLRFNLNFRPVPTTNSRPMGVIPAGTAVPVVGRNQAGDWLLVTYQGQRGWIARWLVIVDGRLADVPLVPVGDPVAVPEQAQEAVFIRQPGPGSRVTSPVRVSGISDPAQHQTITVRLLLADGTVIAQEPASINAPLGQRGEYQVDLPFTIIGEQQAFVQALIRSTRDGRIIHLNSTGITIAEGGAEEIRTVNLQPARVTIHRPAPNTTISGGVATVTGFGRASFEQNLVVEVHDEQGNVVGSAPVQVQSPELGQPGSFSVTVSYTVATAGPGRIVVRDPSAAFGGDILSTGINWHFS
jgi:uncharacterized protein YraI